jgi:hypothetical protein
VRTERGEDTTQMHSQRGKSTAALAEEVKKARQSHRGRSQRHHRPIAGTTRLALVTSPIPLNRVEKQLKKLV